MANTYSQIYIQIIFAVQGRRNLVPKQHREEIHKYITGIVQKRKHKMLAIFCMPDHLHLLAGIQPYMAISDLVRDVKAGSSTFINDRRLISTKFNWQEGYGAFSYSKNQIDRVIKYILCQEAHHTEKTFHEEYIGFLEEFDIPYDEKYLYEWIH